MIDYRVGYANTTYGRDGQTFKAAPFTTIGITDAKGNPCVRLSDLKVGGYVGECSGSVWIDILRPNGAVLVTEGINTSYYWCTEDFLHPETGWYDGEGCLLKDNESVLGNADEITFVCGEGICFNANNGFENATLEVAGQVEQGQVVYTILTDGQSIAGNPLARSVYLSELTVEGYGDDGCDGGVWIDILRPNGAVLVTEGINTSYYWCTEDFLHPETGWYDGEGCMLKDGESVLGNADKIEFKVGDGICVNASSTYVGCVLKFPSLGLK